MADSAHSTGIKMLDSDIQEIIEAGSVKRRHEIKKAIADHSLPKERLFEIVPEAVRRMAALLGRGGYGELCDVVPDSAKQELEKVKQVVERHFLGILNHPAMQDPEHDNSEDDDDDAMIGILNVIANVSHMPFWMGRPPKMRPASRVAFRGIGGDVLLDSMCTWSDLLFILKSLTGILACEMEQGKELVKLVELPYKKMMLRRLKDLERNIEKIKTLGKIYGLDPEAPGTSVQDEE